MTVQKTFIAIKPDSIKQRTVGQILSRFEDSGFNVVEMKTVEVTGELLAKHYDEHVGEEYYPGLVDYMQERSVIACILEGEDVVQSVRGMLGDTDPASAEDGTIRGDFGTDSFAKADKEGRAVRNLAHASATPAEAAKEIELWFS